MALNQKQIMDYGKLGAIAALATGFMLKFISQIVSMIPGVNLDLQSISISTTGLGNVVNTGLSVYAKKLFGLLPSLPLTIPEWGFIALGGALFVIAGAYVADALGMLKGSDKVKRLATVLVVAGIAAGWALSMSIGLPAIGAIIAMVIDALLLSYILVAVDNNLSTKLIP